MQDKTLMYGLYGVFALSFLSLILVTVRHIDGSNTLNEGFIEAFLFSALNIGLAILIAIVVKIYFNRPK